MVLATGCTVVMLLMLATGCTVVLLAVLATGCTVVLWCLQLQLHSGNVIGDCNWLHSGIVNGACNCSCTVVM